MERRPKITRYLHRKLIIKLLLMLTMKILNLKSNIDQKEQEIEEVLSIIWETWPSQIFSQMKFMLKW